VLKSPYGFVEQQEEQIGQLGKRLIEILSFRIDRGQGENEQLKARVRALSPKLTMERGYAVITGSDGKPATKISKGQQIQIQTAKQEISATAEEVREK
jgi:exodeoxyribonuclease VII large subunit